MQIEGDIFRVAVGFDFLTEGIGERAFDEDMGCVFDSRTAVATAGVCP